MRESGGVFWLAAIGAISVAALVWSEWSNNRWRLVAKPAASGCFVAAAVFVGAVGTAYGRWVLIALVFSALGDVALLWRSSRPFLIGLGSFLIGHVAYVAAFVARGIEDRAAVMALVALVVPVVVIIRWLWPHVPPKMQVPVAAYAAVISVMVVTAIGTVALDADVRIMLAALMFYVSDLAVARDRFVEPGPSNRVWGLPLYYCAQFVFAATAAS